MKKQIHRLLTIAAALGTSLAFAQNPPPQPAPVPAPPGAPGAPQIPRRNVQPPDGPRLPEGHPQIERAPAYPNEGDRPGRRRDDSAGGRGAGQSDRSGSRDHPRFAPEPVPAKPQPFLGVVTAPLEPALSAQLGLAEDVGLVVQDLLADSPAAKAGLQKHDVLKQLNDQLLTNPGQLATLVRHYGKDTEVTLSILRKGQEEKLTVKIGERSMPERRRFQYEGFGMRAVPSIEPRLEDIEARMRARRIEEQHRDVEKRARERGAGLVPRTPGLPVAVPQPLPPPSADILREVGPGGAPEVKVLQDQSSTTWNTASARVMLKDDDGEIEVRSENGKRTLSAKNAKGDTVFKGPIDTEEQRKSIPEEFRKKLDQIEIRTRVERQLAPPPQPGKGGQAAAGSFAPRQFELELPDPSAAEPEVQ